MTDHFHFLMKTSQPFSVVPDFWAPPYKCNVCFKVCVCWRKLIIYDKRKTEKKREKEKDRTKNRTNNIKTKE